MGIPAVFSHHRFYPIHVIRENLMIRNSSAITTLLFFLSFSTLHAETRDEKMFAKDVGAIVGLAEACDLEPSEALTAAKANILNLFPQEFEATKGIGEMATSRNSTLCDEAPEILEEFDEYLSSRE